MLVDCTMRVRISQLNKRSNVERFINLIFKHVKLERQTVTYKLVVYFLFLYYDSEWLVQIAVFVVFVSKVACNFDIVIFACFVNSATSLLRVCLHISSLWYKTNIMGDFFVINEKTFQLGYLTIYIICNWWHDMSLWHVCL